jgi:hypothetical protein
MYQLIVVRPEPPGQHTAQVVGIPELRATAATREEAIKQVHVALLDWMRGGQLVLIALPSPPENPLLQFAGRCKDDPDFDLYVEEIQRFRREADERECSDSSSTPTT